MVIAYLFPLCPHYFAHNVVFLCTAINLLQRGTDFNFIHKNGHIGDSLNIFSMTLVA